ncbi:hypothetical protein IAD21_04379 [Abditibacteriota bacterium]|nr:hypothetical protein IAD21_04379 [Abditibacteriota bacterium]
MEFEDVREDVERECERIAAAFGATSWTEGYKSIPGDSYFDGSIRGIDVAWNIQWSNLQLTIVRAGKRDEEGEWEDWCDVQNEGGIQWRCDFNPEYSEFFARALYRLGIEDEYVLSQLPELSAHEKLELRLSMPREFWPQKWLDEDWANC